MTDDARVQELRAALPATQRYAYLNTGTCGPLPRPAFQAMQEAARHDFEQGRIGTEPAELHRRTRAGARAAFARLVGAQEHEIALTRHTGQGLNIVLAGLPWQAGDEVITTDAEHSSLLLPLIVLHRRYGVCTLKVSSAGDLPAAIGAAISDRTRLVALSHVSYATGAIFPLDEVVRVAHARGIPVLVDAAQSAGAIPLDLPALGVDYYAMPGQKWLCGPEGTGALYVRADRCDAVAPTFVGYNSVGSDHSDDDFHPHPGARRFEVGGQNLVDLAGVSASLRWLTDEVGLEWAYRRTAALSTLARKLLAQQPGVEVLTPSPSAGLVSFTVQGQHPPNVVQTLAEHGVVIRSIAWPACCRISTGFFNTEDELARVATLVGQLGRRAED